MQQYFEFESKNYDEDLLKELYNAELNAFLNDWQADMEDAADAAVYQFLNYH